MFRGVLDRRAFVGAWRSSALISGIKYIFSGLRYLNSRYQDLEQAINNKLRGIWLCRLVNGFYQQSNLYFKASFLGGITEIKEQTRSELANNSRTVHLFKQAARDYSDRLLNLFNNGLVVELVRKTKQSFSLEPIYSTSVMIIVAIDINVVLAFMLKQEITLFGWLIRALILFSAMAAAGSAADWKTAKQNSFLLKDK
ncbi:hypothetical protein ACFL2I_00775 [Candidatus Omnitrophota bacterium]